MIIMHLDLHLSPFFCFICLLSENWSMHQFSLLEDLDLKSVSLFSLFSFLSSLFSLLFSVPHSHQFFFCLPLSSSSCSVPWIIILSAHERGWSFLRDPLEKRLHEILKWQVKEWSKVSKALCEESSSWRVKMRKRFERRKRRRRELEKKDENYKRCLELIIQRKSNQTVDTNLADKRIHLPLLFLSSEIIWLFPWNFKRETKKHFCQCPWLFVPHVAHSFFLSYSSLFLGFLFSFSFCFTPSFCVCSSNPRPFLVILFLYPKKQLLCETAPIFVILHILTLILSPMHLFSLPSCHSSLFLRNCL